MGRRRSIECWLTGYGAKKGLGGRGGRRGRRRRLKKKCSQDGEESSFEVWLTCVVVDVVEITDEVLGVIDVDKVVKEVDEEDDVRERIDDEVVGAERVLVGVHSKQTEVRTRLGRRRNHR